MTIEEQIASLTAAGKLQDFPQLAKLAAERAKAASLIAEMQAAKAAEARAAMPTVFTLTTEPQAADDVAVVCVDRRPAWQYPITMPDGAKATVRLAGSISFAPVWFRAALSEVAPFAKEGWFAATPREAIDLWQACGSDPRTRPQKLRAIVSSIESVPLLLCMWRRLSGTGSHTDVVAAALVVRSRLAQCGHDPMAKVIFHSQQSERAANEAAADQIWRMCVGAQTLPELPADPETLQEQRATAGLLISQAAIEARLNGGAA